MDCRPESEEPWGLPSALPLLGFSGFLNRKAGWESTGRPGTGLQAEGGPEALEPSGSCSECSACVLSLPHSSPHDVRRKPTQRPVGAPVSRAERCFALLGGREDPK